MVLVGKHCVGKTTVGRALAARLGWIYDDEIGAKLMKKSNPMEGDGDDEILRQELERDTLRAGSCRVVETWHCGNAAWATYRKRGDVTEQMLDAALKADNIESTIVCFVLKCDEWERRRRWTALDPRQQVTMGDEKETLEKTDIIGQDAETMARKILPNKVHTVWSREGRTVDQMVDEIQCKMLSFAIPGESPVFQSLQPARDAVHLASQVLPEFRNTLPECCIDPSFPCDDDSGYPVFVIVIEGLDGCGKTTLAQRLVQHLGANAVQRKSPPAQLENARTFIESESTNASEHEQKLRDSKAFKTLKRAFFCFGNYILAEEMLRSNTGGPIIIDRFASSTLAYTWGSIDARSSPLKCFFCRVLDFLFPFLRRATWPPDLPKPDVVLLLDATANVRRQRIYNRSGDSDYGVGEWERAFEQNLQLGPAISYHLRNIQYGPPTEIIDANTGDQDGVFRQAAVKLLEHGVAVVFRGVVDAEICESIIEALTNATENKLPQERLERYKWDTTNKIYQSHRHCNVEVCFLKKDELTAQIAVVSASITKATGKAGWEVEKNILPVFRYRHGGEMLPHRDVNLTQLDDYCAILMVSKPRFDFHHGALYINANATVSENGVLETEVQTTRQYFRDLQQGDIVVFRNSLCIHGVDRVAVSTSRQNNTPRGRISASFRM